MPNDLNGRECIVCGTPLVGSQRMYCSNKCKQKRKNDIRSDELFRLRRKVKRLEAKIRELEA